MIRDISVYLFMYTHMFMSVTHIKWVHNFNRSELFSTVISGISSYVTALLIPEIPVNNGYDWWKLWAHFGAHRGASASVHQVWSCGIFGVSARAGEDRPW